MADVVRIVRFLNVLFGLFVAGSLCPALFINVLIIGVLLAGLSIPRGRILEEYGEWKLYTMILRVEI